MKKIFFGCLLLLTFLKGYTQQQVWSEIGVGPTGLNTYGNISSMATDQDGNLYVAGLTETDSDAFIAKWDGTKWTKVGDMHIQGYTEKIVIDHSGHIYVAGGAISNSDNTYFVTMWDGTNWKEVGTTNSKLHSTRPIVAMALDDSDNLYTVSTEEFPNRSDYYYLYNISKWDGIQWTELGVGANRINANNTIRHITFDRLGNLYAVGAFTNASGLMYVAKWNGTVWSEVDTGIIPTFNSAIIDITFDDSNNLFVIVLDTDQDVLNNGVMKWTGTNWIQIPTYTNTSLITIPISLAKGPDGNIYTGGEVYNSTNNVILSRYDGTTSTTLLFLPSQYPIADSRSYAWINSINFDNHGKLYVAGTMFKDYQNMSYTSILTLTTLPPIVNNFDYCINQSATPLTALGANLKWYTTMSQSTALNTPPIIDTRFTDTIYYYVSQTINGNESKRVPVQVIIYPFPEPPYVSSPVIYCENIESTPLQAIGIELKWYSSIEKDITYNSSPAPLTSIPGTLSYFVSQTQHGCEGALSEITVLIKESPEAHITSANTYNNVIQVCNGQSAILTANVATSYIWSTGESTQSISISTANIYSVEVTYSNDCKNSDTIDVRLVNPPALSLGNDTTLCNGETKTIHLNIANASFIWSDGSTNADYTISQNGKYWVAATVLSCPTVKDSIQINYISKIDYNIPNLITYNHDGLNDKFAIPNLISNTHVELYNGWGSLILKSENYTNDWSPENESSGVYYYSISNPNNCVNDYKGWLEVIK